MRNPNPIFSGSRSWEEGSEHHLPIQAPPGASDELRYLLDGVTNESDYRAIVHAHHAVTEGVQDHTISQAAVLFAAVLRAERGREQRVGAVNTSLPMWKAEELLLEVRKARGELQTASEQMQACAEAVKYHEWEDMVRYVFVIVWVLTLMAAIWIGKHYIP